MSRRRLLAAMLCLCSLSCSSMQAMSADAAARDAKRCKALVASLGVDLQVRQSAHFYLVSSAGASPMEHTGQLLDGVYQGFYASFTGAGFKVGTLPEKLVCVCFNSYEEFENYGRAADGTEASWMDGYYSYRTNRVAVVRSGAGGSAPVTAAARPGGPAAMYSAPRQASPTDGLNFRTTSHELAHQLAFNSGIQKQGVGYPFWLTEGLATNFESESPEGVGLQSKPTRYTSRLASARNAGRLIPLDRLATMTSLPTTEGEATRDAYAQAWGLFRFLLDSRSEQLRSYMASLARSWPGEKSEQSLRRRFVQAFGDPAALEREFQQFVLSQR